VIITYAEVDVKPFKSGQKRYGKQRMAAMNGRKATASVPFGYTDDNELPK
jgi:hypothetical protein